MVWPNKRIKFVRSAYPTRNSEAVARGSAAAFGGKTMRNPSFFANALLVLIDSSGAAWYTIGTSSRFTLVLTYFALIAVVGVVSFLRL